MKEAHQEVDFGGRPSPILMREGEQAEERNAKLARSFYYRTNRVFAAPMAFVAAESAPLRPSPVAIHDDSDVARQPVAIER